MQQYESKEDKFSSTPKPTYGWTVCHQINTPDTHDALWELRKIEKQNDDHNVFNDNYIDSFFMGTYGKLSALISSIDSTTSAIVMIYVLLYDSYNGVTLILLFFTSCIWTISKLSQCCPYCSITADELRNHKYPILIHVLLGLALIITVPISGIITYFVIQDYNRYPSLMKRQIFIESSSQSIYATVYMVMYYNGLISEHKNDEIKIFLFSLSLLSSIINMVYQSFGIYYYHNFANYFTRKLVLLCLSIDAITVYLVIMWLNAPFDRPKKTIRLVQNFYDHCFVF